MPELPEVETIARGLAQRVSGDVIESVWLGSKPEPLKSSAADIEAALHLKKILNVRRSGKHIVFDLGKSGTSVGSTSALWIVHLGMTGQLLVCKPDSEVAKHTHGYLFSDRTLPISWTRSGERPHPRTLARTPWQINQTQLLVARNCSFVTVLSVMETTAQD